VQRVLVRAITPSGGIIIPVAVVDGDELLEVRTVMGAMIYYAPKVAAKMYPASSAQDDVDMIHSDRMRMAPEV
jgi:hypothetical protein